MAVVIAGPGRSGTSLLVKILTGCGFQTPDSSWHDDARAGLETRVQRGGQLDIFKDPWFYEYAADLDAETIASIDVLIIPIRSRQHAVASRLVQDRGFQLEHDQTLGPTWRWRTGDRNIPGGIVVDTSFARVSAALGEGLWDVLEWSLRNNVPLRLVHFPRFAQDFAYFWSTLGDVIQRGCDREAAEEAWARTVDPSSVRLGNETVDPLEHLTKAELVGLIERMRSKISTNKQELDDSRTELENLRAENVRLFAQEEAGRLMTDPMRTERASSQEQDSDTLRASGPRAAFARHAFPVEENSLSKRRVILHAGLHKTATTSVQVALSQSAACVYPEAPDPGPGHARAVWQAIGIYGEQRNPLSLVELVKEHDDDRVDLPLVISAESCVHAIFHENGAEAFDELAEYAPTELVVTVRSDDERLASVAQELIKHGAQANFPRYWECALKSELMADGLLCGLFSLARWRRLHVIHADVRNPDAVFQAFSTVLGGEVRPVPAHNVRWPAAKLRMLNHLNRSLSVKHEERLALLESLWRHSEDGFLTRADDEYPPIPQDVLASLKSRFHREMKELTESVGSKLTMYGPDA